MASYRVLHCIVQNNTRFLFQGLGCPYTCPMDKCYIIVSITKPSAMCFISLACYLQHLMLTVDWFVTCHFWKVSDVLGIHPRAHPMGHIRTLVLC